MNENLLFYHFHDVVLLFPLLLITFDMLMEERKHGPFIAAVLFNAIVNYFFFFGEVFFLIAYFLYIDGVGTIMMQATLIAASLAIDTTAIMITILALQVIGLPFTLLFGYLAEKISAKFMICTAVIIYMIIAVLVTVMSFSGNLQLRQFLFYTVAVLIGTAQGGIQSLSRSFYSKIIPKERAAELFAVYNIFGRFTTIVGPVLIACSTFFWDKAELGITMLTVPFILGFILLSKVKVPEN
jgi:UMF1 family MFS transporter